jgi:hypothetical protein
LDPFVYDVFDSASPKEVTPEVMTLTPGTFCILWFVKGFRRWRGCILAPKRNPDLQGFCSPANHSSLSVRGEQNFSKL